MDLFFFLEARPPPLVPLFVDDSPSTLSLPPFSSFLIFFSYCFVFLPCDCDLLGDELANEFGVNGILTVDFHGCFFRGLGDGISFLEFRHSVV